MVQNQFHSSVLRVRSDNGSEFTNGPLRHFFSDKVFCLKPHVWILRNKIVELSVKIDTY